MPGESSLWQWMRKAEDHWGSRLHWRRVENAVSVGDPDVDGVLDGNAFTLELKSAPRPARATTCLRFGSPLKQAQVDWAAAHLAAGGRSGFLVQVGSGSERRVYLIHGMRGPRMMEGVTEDWCREHDLWVPRRPAGLSQQQASLVFVASTALGLR